MGESPMRELENWVEQKINEEMKKKGVSRMQFVSRTVSHDSVVLFDGKPYKISVFEI